jgi:hypothetical protein
LFYGLKTPKKDAGPMSQRPPFFGEGIPAWEGAFWQGTEAKIAQKGAEKRL